MSENKRPRGVRTAVILILILPALGIGLRKMNEDGNPSKDAPARQIDVSVDVRQLGFEETVAYINEQCGGFTYWERGSSANLKVTTLPLTLDRAGKIVLSRRYAGSVESLSWFPLPDVTISEHEERDSITGKPYTSIRFECDDSCITYVNSVEGRAGPNDEPRNTKRTSLVCAYGDQVASALSHAKHLLDTPALSYE